MRFRIPGSDSFPIRFLFHRPCDEIFALSPFYIHTYNINIVCATGECGALAPLSRAGHTVITRPGPRARSSVWGCVLFLTRGEEHLEHLEHLECNHQPHIQGRRAEERTQRAR